jgi:hypothetical protein
MEHLYATPTLVDKMGHLFSAAAAGIQELERAGWECMVSDATRYEMRYE